MLIIVCVALALYLLYLLRKPIGWLLTATFLAVALSGPVNFLTRQMRRGFAITLVYLGLLAFPFALGAVIVPPLVTEANNLADNAPAVRARRDRVRQRQRAAARAQQDYDITAKLQEEAGKLPGQARRRRRRPCATWASGS